MFGFVLTSVKLCWALRTVYGSLVNTILPKCPCCKTGTMIAIQVFGKRGPPNQLFIGHTITTRANIMKSMGWGVVCNVSNKTLSKTPSIFACALMPARKQQQNLACNLTGRSRELHNQATATVGFVQQSFHCSAYGRNETLVIVCSFIPLSLILFLNPFRQTEFLIRVFYLLVHRAKFALSLHRIYLLN